MLSKIKQFVNEHLQDIILIIGVLLISLFSFLAGYIAGREGIKSPIRFEQMQYEQNESSYNWGWDIRT